jgi:PhoPQ-activated pathogenicity-related protein
VSATDSSTVPEACGPRADLKAVAVPDGVLPRRHFTTTGFAAAAALLAGRRVEAGEAAAVAEAVTESDEQPAARAEATGPLAEYVAAVDPATRVEPVASGELPGGSWRTVRLVSQSWRGVEWTHELSLFLPTKRGPTPGRETMLFWIDGGSAGKVPVAGETGRGASEALRTLALVANAAGLPAAVIRQVPYQPLFDGLSEDGLIAHSFVEYARTGDATWPLLLPMVKSAVAGMAAAAEIARTAWGLDIDRFVLTGASKRGWTTWLTAAIDARVVGVVPLVIDMLSMERHLQLQVESFGGMSDQLEDYKLRGVEKLLATPRGRELIGIVDPFSYRDRLATPKLIGLGTNDPYWPLQSLELYRDGLPGPCWVSYCPNAGHGIPLDRVVGLVAAMGRHASGHESLPDLRWRFDSTGNNAACVVRSGIQPERLLLWRTESDTRDFRKARWESTVVGGAGPEWKVVVEPGAKRWTAAVVEVLYARETVPLVLTTSVHVRDSKA